MTTLLSPGKEPGQPLPLPPPQVCISLPREDSEAEEDWLTLKAISESLSSWEPLRDPDGDGITGLDCRVPATKETPSGGRCPASPWLSLPLCLMGGQELPHRAPMESYVRGGHLLCACPAIVPVYSWETALGFYFTRSRPVRTSPSWSQRQFREGRITNKGQ